MAFIDLFDPKGKRMLDYSFDRNGRDPEPGDCIALRDFSGVLPREAWSLDKERGKWQLVPYELQDGQKGRLLVVNDVAGDDGDRAVPAELELDPGLSGWYAVWVGIPNLDMKPIINTEALVDIALDGEPFSGLGPEFGRRHKKLMGPTGVEINCFWKCVKLDGRQIKLRVPFGTYLSQPWGLVRSILSSVQLVKVDETQAHEYIADISNPAHKKVLQYVDGFSHYWHAGKPGKGIDLRYAEKHGFSDHKILFLQTPSTAVANWPSEVTDYPGATFSEEEWKSMRRGDKRVYEYIRWASENGQEGMRVLSDACAKVGLEFHASLRMNLFWRTESIFGMSDKFLNGPWWFGHPEARKPGKAQIDYAHPAARRFVLDILSELAANYEVGGINLDFTRWPPIADPQRHDCSVLTSFIKEVRAELDRISQDKGKRLVLSATMVEGAHARDEDRRMMTLEDQRIDFEGWVASGALDFVCVQTWRHDRYIGTAHRHGVRYYCEYDNVPPETPGGREDTPEWCDQEDPVPGEELHEQPPIVSSVDPLEMYRAALKQLRAGADGVSFMNFAGRSMGRLGHLNEMEELAAAGKIWGQTIGEPIVLHESY